MVDRLPAWLFLSLALILIGMALIPVARLVLTIDSQIGIQPLTMVMLLISGLMCGLSAMILLVRRQPSLKHDQSIPINFSRSTKFHACGLLLFSFIPLANFLLCYWLWIRNRHKSEWIDSQGKEVLNFQITVYLYLLLSLFLTLAVIGVIFIPLILLVHLVLTVIAILRSAAGHQFRYPFNIPIIQGRNQNNGISKDST